MGKVPASGSFLIYPKLSNTMQDSKMTDKEILDTLFNTLEDLSSFRRNIEEDIPSYIMRDFDRNIDKLREVRISLSNRENPTRYKGYFGND